MQPTYIISAANCFKYYLSKTRYNLSKLLPEGSNKAILLQKKFEIATLQNLELYIFALV